MKPTSIKIHPLPSNDMEPLKKEVGQLSVDIYRTDKELVIIAPIAGVGKDDVKLSITDDVLVIKGERPSHENIPEENYYTQECFWGNFSRAIVLPQEADTKNISASFENNVLEIRIPKQDVEQTKIIKIQAP
ncbi:MAG: Hsp20/alpha crystallin family protein [Candidatus Peregrinibacteria bacterium]|nr:Hsp20/alpha crystallin family protein [Candidatus Peregrinibacteria bacterium]